MEEIKWCRVESKVGGGNIFSPDLLPEEREKERNETIFFIFFCSYSHCIMDLCMSLLSFSLLIGY